MSLIRLAVVFTLLLFNISCSDENESSFLAPQDETCDELAIRNEFIVMNEDGKTFLSDSRPESNFLWYEHNYKIKPSYHPNSDFTDEVSVSNRDLWISLGADRFWSRGFRGQNITVAVVDSGVTPGAEFIKDSFFINRADSLIDGIDSDENGLVDDVSGWNFFENTREQNDEINHGTSIAHLIAAKDNSAIGTGLAPESKILPLDIIGDDGGDEFAAVKAIEYGLSKGVRIFNNSWSTQCSTLLHEKYNEWKFTNALFIHSSGNEGKSIDEYKFSSSNFKSGNFIAVGSNSLEGERSDFSNFGTNVEFYAPGESLYILKEPLFSDDFELARGTSYSAAVVSGFAALVWSEHPNWSAVQVKDYLYKNSVIKNDGFRVIDFRP